MQKLVVRGLQTRPDQAGGAGRCFAGDESEYVVMGEIARDGLMDIRVIEGKSILNS
jgi:hypothetical protein